MKFVKPIEVQGITRIVIDRRYKWENNRMADDWVIRDENGDVLDCKTTHNMMRYVRHKLNKRTRRAWVSGNTLNIVMKDTDDDDKCSNKKCSNKKCDRYIMYGPLILDYLGYVWE